MNTGKKTNWLLVWTGLFVWMYPLLSFLFAIAALFYKPTAHVMPTWMLAANMAFVWTILGWQNQGKNNKPAPLEVSRSSRRWSKKAFGSAAFLFVSVVGAAAKGISGQPSWLFVILHAVAIPASLLAANLLLERSNLLPSTPPQALCDTGLHCFDTKTS